MVREIRGIPPAPRRVLWRSVLGHRWPVGLAAFVLAIYGGVWTWMLFLGQSGLARDGRRLDHEASIRLPARIVRVDPDIGRLPDGSAAERCVYEFEHRGQRLQGQSYAAAGRHQPDTQVEIELLPHEPVISRIRGEAVHLLPAWVEPGHYLATVLVPGLLLGLAYLASVFHLRHVLVHGDAGVARVLSVRPVRGLLPEMLSVRFEFRDHRADLRRSRHWVRAHSALGTRLRAVRGDAPLMVPVLHDRRFPQHCRLVWPDGFLRGPLPVDPETSLRT